MPKYPFSFKKYWIDIKGNNFEIQKGRATQLDAHWMQQSVEVSNSHVLRCSYFAVLFLNSSWAWPSGMLGNQFRKQHCKNIHCIICELPASNNQWNVSPSFIINASFALLLKLSKTTISYCKWRSCCTKKQLKSAKYVSRLNLCI